MDKKITIEVTSAEGDPSYKATGWLEDWIVEIYFALDPMGKIKVRNGLEQREARRRAE